MKKQKMLNKQFYFEMIWNPSRLIFFTQGEKPQDKQKSSESTSDNRIMATDTNTKNTQEQIKNTLNNSRGLEPFQEGKINTSPDAQNLMEKMKVDVFKTMDGTYIFSQNGHTILSFTSNTAIINMTAKNGDLYMETYDRAAHGGIDQSTKDLTIIRTVPTDPDWHSLQRGSQTMYLAPYGALCVDIKTAQNNGMKVSTSLEGNQEKQDIALDKAKSTLSKNLKKYEKLLKKWGFAINDDPEKLAVIATKDLQYKDEGDASYRTMPAGRTLLLLNPEMKDGTLVFNTESSFYEENGNLVWEGKENNGRKWKAFLREP